MDSTEKLSFIKENIRLFYLKTIKDCFTAVLMHQVDFRTKGFDCLVMSENPYDKDGVGVMTKAHLGRHLGKRIQYRSLPQGCQKLICEVLFEGRKF